MSLVMHSTIANRSNMINHRGVNAFYHGIVVECDGIEIQIQGGTMLWQDMVQLARVLASVAVRAMRTVLREVIRRFALSEFRPAVRDHRAGMS